jgi:hypothetical protein
MAVSACPWHSVMQQMAEIAAAGPSWRAARQQSAPHPPSPSRCGGMTASEFPATAMIKRIVNNRFNIGTNRSIYIRCSIVVSIKGLTK